MPISKNCKLTWVGSISLSHMMTKTKEKRMSAASSLQTHLSEVTCPPRWLERENVTRKTRTTTTSKDEDHVDVLESLVYPRRHLTRSDTFFKGAVVSFLSRSLTSLTSFHETSSLTDAPIDSSQTFFGRRKFDKFLFFLTSNFSLSQCIFNISEILDNYR